eukprot:3328303-Ditylum_brightwellii.AAC.1
MSPTNSFGNPHLLPGINPNQHTLPILSLSRAANAVYSMLLLDESPLVYEQDDAVNQGGVVIGRQSLSPGDMVVLVVGSQEIMPAPVALSYSITSISTNVAVKTF